MGTGARAELEAAGVLEGRGEYGAALRLLLTDEPARPVRVDLDVDRGGRWCQHGACPECWVAWSHGRAPERCPDPGATVCARCRDYQQEIYEREGRLR
ncbi:MAG TPA: hypothetical protein VGX21_03210 [Methylomirabilota bacterium]|jgi:hypothetical protein|nr:hypothetical protein [Methylomirabilota bacterium]